MSPHRRNNPGGLPFVSTISMAPNDFEGEIYSDPLNQFCLWLPSPPLAEQWPEHNDDE